MLLHPSPRHIFKGIVSNLRAVAIVMQDLVDGDLHQFHVVCVTGVWS
jgi:hypothetical protein